MGVFTRMKEMTKASVNEFLDKVEDPIVMLNQYLRDMEDEIAQAEVVTARQIAHERKIKGLLEEAIRISGEREAAAAAALKLGQDAAVRQALEDKIYYDLKIAEYTGMYPQTKNHADETLRQLHEMKEQFYHMRNKRNELISRTQIAKAAIKMAQLSNDPGVLGGNHVSRGNAAKGFNRMEEKIMQIEVEAELIRKPFNPAQALSGNHDSALIEKIDAELAQLKEKNGAEPGSNQG